MHTPLMVADEGDIYELLDRFTGYDEESSGPEAKWDYFGISENPVDFLKLKEPRQIKKFFGMISIGETLEVAVAKKNEIDKKLLLANPPAALFFEDVLYECPFDCEKEGLLEWIELFKQKFNAIPEERTLQMIDAHS